MQDWQPEYRCARKHATAWCRTAFQSISHATFSVSVLRSDNHLAALYNGYLYVLSYLFNDAFSVIFGPTGKGYNTLQIGLCFLGIVVGITLGPPTQIWQERSYQKRVSATGGANIPEARVQLGQVAAVTFPISLFIFAFTSYTWLSWVAPVVASGLWGWSIYTLILMTYTYTEDSYGIFSASALAGIGLVRNAAGCGFPLFARQLFINEGFQYAGLLLACLALVLMPIPFVLARKGERLRQRSPWARQMIEHEDKTANELEDENVHSEDNV